MPARTPEERSAAAPAAATARWSHEDPSRPDGVLARAGPRSGRGRAVAGAAQWQGLLASVDPT
jgi:hypothetical protein